MSIINKLKWKASYFYWGFKALLYLRKMNKAKTREIELYYYNLYDVRKTKQLFSILFKEKGV